MSVTLREGKYHQVKRMLAARGKPVVYLKRLSMGPIALDPALAPGEWRPLTGEEKALLRRGTREIQVFGVLHKKLCKTSCQNRGGTVIIGVVYK